MAQITTDYTIGIKRQAVTALEPLFHSDQFPFPELKDRVYVGLEYPFEQVQYPAIYITYNETSLHNTGVGSTEQATDDNGNATQVKHWLFQGSLNFNVMTLSQKERDELGAALINIFAFGATNDFLGSFSKNLMNGEYVQIQYPPDTITPRGNQTGQTPWASETELVFGTQYSLNIVGDFYSDQYTGNLVQWEYVQVHPYDTETGGTPLF